MRCSDGRFTCFLVDTRPDCHLPISPASALAGVVVPLGGISQELVEALRGGGRLEARIAGRGRDGSPACASVPLLVPGWHVRH